MLPSWFPPGVNVGFFFARKDNILVKRKYQDKDSSEFARAQLRLGAVGFVLESGEVNWLIDGRCGERLPAIKLAHVDGEQRTEQLASSVCRRQHSLRFDPTLVHLVPVR